MARMIFGKADHLGQDDTGRHYQNTYVTRNIDAAAARFRKQADVRTILETEVAVELWTPQGSGTGVQRLAFVWVADLNIELIQPIEGEVLALYRDALPADDGLRFRHVCHRIEEWEPFMAKVEAQPFPVVPRGGTPGMLEFLYLDNRRWLGHYTEYVGMGPDRWAAMGGR